jgi:hypothetical protein
LAFATVGATIASALARDEGDDLVKQGVAQLDKDPAGAAETLAKAAALRPSDASVAYDLGVALGRAGKLKEATESFQKAEAFTTDPTLRADARFNLGVLELQRAAGALKEQVGDDRQKPVDPTQMLNGLSRAERQFRRSIDADPTSQGAADAAKWIERLQQKRQEVHELIEKQRQQQQQQQKQDQNQQQQQGSDQQQQDQQQQGQQQQQQQQQQGGEQGQQQQQQEDGKPKLPDLSQRMQDLARQQSQQSQNSQQAAGAKQSQQQREQRQQQQAELSQKTEQAAQQQAERQAQQGKQPKPDPAQQKLDKARDEQAKAQEAIGRGDDKAAAEAQKKAAQQLMEAAQEAAKQEGQDQPQPQEQEGEEQAQSSGDPSGQAQGRSAWDFTAAEILDKERREREILRRIRKDNRRIFVEKDW